jgi:DNA polymerase-1
MIDAFFREHPEAKQWIEQVHDFVLTNGYYYTPFGRIRRLPAAFDENQSVRNESLRQAQNFPVQSSASDITVVALAGIEKDIYEAGLKATPCLAVHDMLAFDSPLEEAKEVVRIMDKHLCNPVQTFKELLPEFDMSWLDVPILNDTEVGPSWGQAYAVKNGKLKVADKDEGAPETVYIEIENLYDWLAEHPRKVA